MGCAAQKQNQRKMTFDQHISILENSCEQQHNPGMVAFKSLKYQHMAQNLEQLQITCSPQSKKLPEQPIEEVI